MNGREKTDGEYKPVNIFYDYQIAVLQYYGGVSRYHYELMKAINETGEHTARMSVIFPRNHYLAGYLHKRAIHNYYYQMKRIERLNRFLCKEQVSKQKFDIVHPTWVDPYLFPFHQNVVITIHDMIPEVLNLPFPEDIENKKTCIEKARKIIAISQNTRNDILTIYPQTDPDKIEVVYHGKNTLPSPEKPELPIDGPYLLFVGRRNLYKNGMLLIRELGEYISDQNIHIIYAGEAFSDPEKETIKNAGVENLVHRLQPNDHELAYLYQHATCCVYPSEYEGFGFPLLEAFSNACPIICANRTCLPEIGKDAAMYFDPGKPGDLLLTVDEIIKDEKKRNEMIQKGFARASDFSWAKTAEKTLAAYQSLL